MLQKYPVTPTQQSTALRRGWTAKRSPKTGKLIEWKAPDNFTAADEAKIREAQQRRQRRKIGAD